MANGSKLKVMKYIANELSYIEKNINDSNGKICIENVAHN